MFIANDLIELAEIAFLINILDEFTLVGSVSFIFLDSSTLDSPMNQKNTGLMLTKINFSQFWSETEVKISDCRFYQCFSMMVNKSMMKKIYIMTRISIKSL